MKRGEIRQRDICAAAIAEFTERGYAGASMSRIAERAGISRPALYQYFDNKTDIFASAFVALFEGLADGARAALGGDGSLAEQLDGFLQAYHGDLWQHVAASPFIDEIIEAKDDRLSALVGNIVAPLWHEVDQHLATHIAGSGATERRRDWIDVLQHAPKGCWSDNPDIGVYRRRLSALARGIAADVEAG